MRTGALIGVLCLAACSPRPRTEVLVRVFAEPMVAAELARLEVRVLGGDDLSDVRLEETVSSASLALPLTVAIIPRDRDPSRRFRFEAHALDAAGDPIGLVRATSGFLPERTLVLDLVLEDCCRGVACEPDETCRACACAHSAIAPDRLPELGADASSPDASRDASPDGSTPDASIPDGSMPPDARVDAAPLDAFVPPACSGGSCIEIPQITGPVVVAPNREPEWRPPLDVCPASALAVEPRGYGAGLLHNVSDEPYEVRLTTMRFGEGLSVDPILVVYPIATPDFADPTRLPDDRLACVAYADDVIGDDAELEVVLAPDESVLWVVSHTAAGPLLPGVQVQIETLFGGSTGPPE